MILTCPAECPPLLGGIRASKGLFGAALPMPALMCFGWGGRLGFIFKTYDHETTRDSSCQLNELEVAVKILSLYGTVQSHADSSTDRMFRPRHVPFLIKVRSEWRCRI